MHRLLAASLTRVVGHIGFDELGRCDGFDRQLFVVAGDDQIGSELERGAGLEGVLEVAGRQREGLAEELLEHGTRLPT